MEKKIIVIYDRDDLENCICELDNNYDLIYPYTLLLFLALMILFIWI